jgi:hypothetical protein
MLTLMSGQLHARSLHPEKGAGVSPMVGLDVAVKGETPAPAGNIWWIVGLWNIRYLHQTCILFQNNNDFTFVTSNIIDTSYNNAYAIHFVLEWNTIAILSRFMPHIALLHSNYQGVDSM